jgi:hypothetical protein
MDTEQKEIPTPRCEKVRFEAYYGAAIRRDCVPLKFAEELERSLSFSQQVARNTQAELIRAKQEVQDLQDVLNKFKLGYQGCCYACEPVGILNQRLEGELEEIKKVTMEIIDNTIKAAPEWLTAVARFLELTHTKYDIPEGKTEIK